MLNKSRVRFFKELIPIIVLGLNSSFYSISQDSISTKVDALLQKYVKPNAPAPSLSYSILDLFLPTDEVEQMKKTVSSEKDLKKYTGYYKEQNSDMKLEVQLKEDTLRGIGQGNIPMSLIAYDKGKFTRLKYSNVVYDFLPEKYKKCDLIVYFGGTPFYFEKAKFVEPSTINLYDYTGSYYSEEFAVKYEIYVENNVLYVKYPNQNGMKLYSGQKDEFGNGQRVLFRFEKNNKNQVIKLSLAAEGTVKNVEFIRK